MYDRGQVMRCLDAGMTNCIVAVRYSGERRFTGWNLRGGGLLHSTIP